MNKASSAIAVATLVAAVVFSAAAPTATGVLRVPEQFATIQDAVDAATPGDTIHVATGTYCENVTITKSDLRLLAVPSGQVMLTGACSPGGPYGIQVLGTTGSFVFGVEIMGFVVEHFETGIWLRYVTKSRIQLNEVRNNVSGLTPALPATHTAQGVLLEGSTNNDVSQNVARENGHLGIGLLRGSSGNTVRGNRLYDNQAQQGMQGSCSLMLWGAPASINNQVVENEVIGQKGVGIMIGPGAPTGNVIGQNRVYGHADEGIITVGQANGNVIQHNDTRGNAKLAWFDLGEWSAHPDGNIWLRNLGTCAPGSGICRE